VRCANKGNAYAQAREVSLVGADGAKIAGAESAAYILPGITRTSLPQARSRAHPLRRRESRGELR
jgi:hypothetical protein